MEPSGAGAKTQTGSLRRLLIIAAHPDDETLGAAALMNRAQGCRILHITDGAPRDRAFRSASARQPRTAYAVTRRRELLEALSLVGLAEPDVESLDVTDQDAAFHLAALSHEVAGMLRTFRPTLVVTHAYEGGHPDHDAAAFAVSAASALLARAGQRPPACMEMALYHGEAGTFRAGRFLTPHTGRAGVQELSRRLTPIERVRKHAMLRCFATQQQVLRPFYALEEERYRTPPRYDFCAAPHPGDLLYERNGFPLRGARWRELARSALRELKL